MSTPPHEERPRFGSGHSDDGKVAALVTWALYILSIPSVALLVPIGLVVAYVARGGATGVARQHIDAQIRLFWSTLMWTIVFSVLWLISLALSVIVIGIPFLFLFWGALFLLMVWFTVKSIFGLIALLGDRAP
ncbi:hypothetical protein [Brevundimonas sp.]|uniref:hypothetical protein n=1 Tax=Brevundimonas sp. TaxID=1871086 RepID=UPI002D66030D|nr:hypothetical protein [Brevundimonas sp.]HYC69338.1 hypothetical protein [Brevundimonas sp.]